MADAPPFVHLHCHTQYSLLDGAMKVKEMCAAAAEDGQEAVAITDHGNLFGAVDFFLQAKQRGVKPIIGCEVYLSPTTLEDKRHHVGLPKTYHLILLATDERGYRNLLSLVSTGYLEGFYYKPRIDKRVLAEHAEGLVGLSSCLGGEVPRHLRNGDPDAAARAAAEYREILGEGNFYLELQRHGIEAQERVNQGLVELGRRLGIPLVATNDCHYLRQEQAAAHEILMCLQQQTTRSNPNRWRYESDQLYFRTRAEMAELFADLPEALEATCAIAERCTFELDTSHTYLPSFDIPEGYERPIDYLRHLAEEGLERRLAARPPARHGRADYERRLERELAIIDQMGFPGYFLIVWDFVRYAKEHGVPVGPGRGSAAGSLVAYCLGITDLDPLPYDLLFERFLNPERVSMPDIDMDFCMDRRGEVLAYVTRKYSEEKGFGHEAVAQIITFGTMQARAILRDVGRVLELPYAECDRLAKLVPNELGITLEEALAREPRLRQLAEEDERIAEVIRYARELEGLNRHASTHAAGVVIGDRPLREHTPLFLTPEGDVVTQYDKRYVEKVGLVKFDFLGLKTLTVIDRAVRLANEERQARGEPPLVLSEIPLDDAATFDLLCRGDNTGVFQLESGGMREILVKLKPRCFEDVIALVALYRPGPLGSGMVDDFIDCKHGRKPIRYLLPELEPILKDTYGLILYQEQVMQIAAALAGYSLGEADLLRRAMGKKDAAEMARQHDTFVERAVARGVARDKAEEIFRLMAEFAKYGFNKSHSAAYGLVAYQTAYLKAHHPVAFMAAIISADMDNTDKVVKYVHHCRENGIEVLPPDVNRSTAAFRVEGNAIRFGLAAVKNVGAGAIEAVVQARREGGPFTSLVDFCERIAHVRPNRRMLEALVKAGAFDSIHPNRAQLLANLEPALAAASQALKERDTGQASLLDTLEVETSDLVAEMEPVEPWPERVKLEHEKEALGFYISGHPLTHYREEIRRYATCPIAELQTWKEEGPATVVGLIQNVVTKLNKQGDRFAILTVEGMSGLLEVVLFARLYREVEHLLESREPVVISGRLQVGERGVSLRADTLVPLADHRAAMTREAEITLSPSRQGGDDYRVLRQILSQHPGKTPLFLRLHLPGGDQVRIRAGDRFAIHPSDELLAELRQELGDAVEVAFR
ncbi:MAG: DNA polymerase III subunit alpha [Nitrospirae bacterium]|nr:MAG: DNA polymerase III subunit alpha [Nitrospirota bacterium]